MSSPATLRPSSYDSVVTSEQVSKYQPEHSRVVYEETYVIKIVASWTRAGETSSGSLKNSTVAVLGVQEDAPSW